VAVQRVKYHVSRIKYFGIIWHVIHDT